MATECIKLFDAAPTEETRRDRASQPAPKRSRRINCPQCDLAAAEIVNGALLIRSRHHGKTHVTAISLDKMKELIEESLTSL